MSSPTCRVRWGDLARASAFRARFHLPTLSRPSRMLASSRQPHADLDASLARTSSCILSPRPHHALFQGLICSSPSKGFNRPQPFPTAQVTRLHNDDGGYLCSSQHQAQLRSRYRDTDVFTQRYTLLSPAGNREAGWMHELPPAPQLRHGHVTAARPGAQYSSNIRCYPVPHCETPSAPTKTTYAVLDVPDLHRKTMVPNCQELSESSPLRRLPWRYQTSRPSMRGLFGVER